jgi:hypothetical protein
VGAIQRFRYRIRHEKEKIKMDRMYSVRMDHRRLVTKVFEKKPQGRRRGRPKLRWL